MRLTASRRAPARLRIRPDTDRTVKLEVEGSFLGTLQPGSARRPRLQRP
jgi:hypothetical protein